MKSRSVVPWLTALLAVLVLVLTASFGIALAAGYTQQAKLTAGDGAAGDWFGWSIAISGDTMVVAAPADDDNGTDSGSVYVFQRIGSSWSQQAKLTAGDVLGDSVAISGDTVVVGAAHEDDNGTNSGSAYVFVLSGSSWSQQAKLTAGDAAVNDQFGSSVAIDGDTVVVGSPQDDDNGASSGSAYVFVRSGSTWTQQQKLTASDGATLDLLASRIAISGDTFVAGAAGHDTPATGAGAVYVFVRSGSTWTQQQKLSADDAGVNDFFGASVGISGDAVAVGTTGDNTNGTAAGAAYLFGRSGTTWTQIEKLTASDGAAVDVFGGSIAIDRDALAVGASGNDDAGSSSGSAYVFEPPPTPTPTPTAVPTATPVVPSLGHWGLIAMAGLLAAAFVWRLRRTAASGTS